MPGPRGPLTFHVSIFGVTRLTRPSRGKSTHSGWPNSLPQDVGKSQQAVMGPAEKGGKRMGHVLVCSISGGVTHPKTQTGGWYCWCFSDFGKPPPNLVGFKPVNHRDIYKINWLFGIFSINSTVVFLWWLKEMDPLKWGRCFFHLSAIHDQPWVKNEWFEYMNLGVGFKHVFFSPLPGIQFDGSHIFFKWVGSTTN